MGVFYRLMFEDDDLEPIDDYDVFESKRAAFRYAVAHPEPGVGSVYLTEVDDYDVVVIAGRYINMPVQEA
jgi:hypothetical protein